jgi:ATP-binding cassette subfamily F protein 3
MPLLFELDSIELAFGGRPIFSGITESFFSDRKCALIGRNGAGKTTLCRLITGEESPDYGELRQQPSLRIGYLRQGGELGEDESALDFLRRSSGSPEWRCGEAAGKLGIDPDKLAAPARALSGGWRTLLKLAALMLEEPSFLILDEPTNFLDLRTLLKLENFLNGWSGGALIISHDRSFLNRTCSHTLELSLAKLHSYPGTVEQYFAHRQERLEHQERVNVARQSKMKQLQRFIDKNRAGANTAAQAKNKQKQLDRIEEIHEIETEHYVSRVRLPLPEPLRKTVYQCEELAIGYDGKAIAENISFSIEPGDKVAIVGDNGQGKTTLLRTMTGSLPEISGKQRWAIGASPVVYAQHVYEALPPNLPARDYLIANAGQDYTEKDVLNIAGGFGFSRDDGSKRIAVLSGGERARLSLAGIFLRGGNVLALDEPVNHLDVETVDALAQALEEYPGTIVFVSHERDFCRRVATRVLEVSNGGVRNFPGDYADYLAEVDLEQDEATRAAPKQIMKKESEGKNRYELSKKSASCERRLEKQAQVIAALHARMLAEPDWQQAAKLKQEHDLLAADQQLLEEEWLLLQEELESCP